MQERSGCDDGYLKPVDLVELHRSSNIIYRSYENDNSSEELYSEICDVSVEHSTKRANGNRLELEIKQNNNSGVIATSNNNSSSTNASTQQSCQQLLR